MKFLVISAAILATVGAVPITPGYGIPVAAPIETINLPEAPPVLEPEFLRRIAGVRVASPLPVPAALPVQIVPASLPIAPVAPAVVPRVVPLSAPSSQFHAQDELGGFSFGYSNINSHRNEIRTPDGVTRGYYEYVDANNVVQRVEYISDDLNGFRVIGTNLPVAPLAQNNAAPVQIADTPEVAAAKAEFQKTFEEAVARNAEDAEEAEEPKERRKRSALTNGYGIPVANPVTVTVPAPAPIPVAVPAPEPIPIAVPAPVSSIRVVPTTVVPKAVIVPQAFSSQYNAQDELGGVAFGYQNPNSARQEVRTPDGVTRGAYSYVDANGITQTVSYVADALGFRVVGTNLPVAPVA